MVDPRGQVTVRELDPEDEADWDGFVETAPGGMFFHLVGWRRVIEGAFRHRTYYMVAERAGVITGVLPLTLVKTRLFGASLISNAFCVEGGPIGDAESVHALEQSAIQLM